MPAQHIVIAVAHDDEDVMVYRGFFGFLNAALTYTVVVVVGECGCVSSLSLLCLGLRSLSNDQIASQTHGFAI